MPAVETIKSMRFVTATGKADSEFMIPENEFRMVSLLFEGSRRDERPAKWETLGDLFVTLHSGDALQFDIYSTHQPTAAFKLNGQYYRGGIDEQFRQVLTKAISNKRMEHYK
jgi:hypothetical protein